MKKFMLRIMPIVLVALMIFVTPTFAAKSVEDIMNTNASIGTVDTAVNKIWGTVLTVLQILAVAAIVFAGVKYMFASAEGKADLKSGMIGLVVGAILVFGASQVVKVIMSATGEVLK